MSKIHNHYDVIIIGSGAAGLYAALCLRPDWRVALITKDNLKTGASDWAQGGIAAAIAPTDSPQLHLEDTLRAGVGLCDRSVVEFLVSEAAKAISSLVDLGVAFDRQGNELSLTREAAHSHPRVLHAADTTGKAIVTTLTEKVLAQPNISVFPQAYALNLWRDDSSQGCQGVSVLYQQEISWIRASAVILATGGGGQVFAQTTNPSVSTGDGVALAWRAGAQLRDLEFFQFHPTALMIPGAPHFLISEAVRGEGAHLIDEAGDRFAFAYHQDGELAPRDVVSRAIFTHLQKYSTDPTHAHVYLDLSSIAPERIRYRFPNIIRVCQEWGVDVLGQPIPVAPAAHYWMGGVVTHVDANTSIPGLYAVGETASTGVHGANRLASNSLLECLVFAAQLSQLSLPSSNVALEADSQVQEVKADFQEAIKGISKIRQELPILMWQNAGICREGNSLSRAIAQVQYWRQQLRQNSLVRYTMDLKQDSRVIFTHPAAETHLRLYAETFNLLDIAYLILKGAAFRTESRGGHYRLDYPYTLKEWQAHTLVKAENWQKSL